MTIDVLSPKLKKYGTKRQGEYLDAVLKHGSSTKAAEDMGVNRRTVDRAISALKREAIEAGVVLALPDKPSVLFLDIETAPILGHLWSIWQNGIAPSQVVADWYMMSWAGKWMGESEDIFSFTLTDCPRYRPGTEDDSKLAHTLWAALDRADYVIAHNGIKFDIRKINTRFLAHDLPPTSPYKTIDTKNIASKVFGFTSNSLDFLARALLNERKEQTGGMELWQNCIAGDKEAWEIMRRYNEKDVELLEGVYYKLRAWDNNHPIFAVNSNMDIHSCTVCGSTNIRPTDKPVTTAVGAYLGYRCRDCGHHMRGSTNIRTDAQRRATLRNVVK
jgi:hypothetical protein